MGLNFNSDGRITVRRSVGGMGASCGTAAVGRGMVVPCSTSVSPLQSQAFYTGKLQKNVQG